MINSLELDIHAIQIAMQKSRDGNCKYNDAARANIIYSSWRNEKNGDFNVLLYSLIKSKNIDHLEDALSLGLLKVLEKERPFSGFSPFDDIALEGYLEGFQAMEKHGFLIDNGRKSIEAIINSAWRNHFDFFRYFYEKNYVNNDSRSQYGWSAFDSFAMRNNIEALDYLLINGFDINSINGNHGNALNSAIRLKSIDAAVFLINSGIDVELALKTIIGLPYKTKDDIKGMKKLLKTFSEAISNSDISSSFTLNSLNALLLIEALDGKHKNMESLIKKGAAVNYANENGKTPFLAAAEGCNISCINTLTAYGANANHFDKDGNSAFYYALNNKNVTIDFLKKLAEIGVSKLFNNIDSREQDRRLSDVLKDKSNDLRVFVYSLKDALILNASIERDYNHSETFEF